MARNKIIPLLFVAGSAIALIALLAKNGKAASAGSAVKPAPASEAKESAPSKAGRVEGVNAPTPAEFKNLARKAINQTVGRIIPPKKQLLLETPELDFTEDQTSPSRNKIIKQFDTLTGKIVNTRELFRRSLKPRNVRLDFRPPGAQKSALDSPAGTLSSRKLGV